jgi:hypothetical protein
MRAGRRLTLTLLLVIITLGLAGLPVVLTVVFKWYHTTLFAGVTGKGSGIYIILVVFYVFWLPLVLAGLLVVSERLGYRYELREVERRPAGRERRRTLAGFGFLARRPTMGQADEGDGRDRAAGGDEPRASDTTHPRGAGHRDDAGGHRHEEH